MDFEGIKFKLNKMLPKHRILHSEGVADCAVKLSEIYGYDKDKAYLAGMLHDCAKYLSHDEVNYYVKKYEIYLDEYETDNLALSHSVIGSVLVRHEFLIDDIDIITAIRYHTTGKAKMDILEKIIYIADLIEVNRDYPGVDELRKLVYSGKMEEALLKSFNNTIKLVIDRNQIIHPRTVEARNYILNKGI
ncbi:bis(5'-nucleosyl)-tetraphosphatase (symmetrical) YqeK [Paraclostridium sordellii]|uniref:bis(5'-nucleosyl)-tetraphosphatase (symmetrical) YqeK n=1 Tax=Paraclostridium sordellii TaxID=1505 RepID=UPI0005E5559D|nr:bis(5'-nucleosyl)-tetraphosphatase (symmetrical) YqeK [Paeniclostridium sordellii]CEP79410.1 hydrolase [[Clostridium] sordellii] [Paeniclostridium sordellii]